LFANAIKSSHMIFGELPKHLVPIHTGDDDLALVSSYTYVGITFQSTARDIFTLHYKKKEAAAHHVAMMIFKKDGTFGTIDAVSLLRMYASQVDPHLTFGCEVVVDVSRGLLRGLEGRQISFIRRTLGLNNKSSHAMLFFVTGVMPIYYRRIILRLRYFSYLLSLNDSSYASNALRENFALFKDRESCWLGDIVITLRQLSPPIILDNVAAVDGDAINLIIDRVRKHCSVTIHSQVNANKTMPLLHRSDLPLDRPLRLQTFLKEVYIPAHRRALTLLVTGCHRLAVVTGRWDEQARQERVCRLCRSGKVEDEKHALFECMGCSDFMQSRADFFHRIFPVWPGASRELRRLGGDAFIRRIIFGSNVDLLRALARLAAKIYFLFVKKASVQ